MSAETRNGAAIEFRDVSFSPAGGPNTLDHLALAIRDGETFVLLGRSGSGKTTALRLINRLLEPTNGSVFVEGRSTLDWPPIPLRRRIGYVIQDAGLFPHFTVERNIGLVPWLDQWPANRRRARVMELLQMIGLDPQQFAQRYPHELSGGQRQRVGVARALAADPPILLMDEPFGALDPLTRGEMQREFIELQKRLRKTVVFVTHDTREALFLGSRIAFLEAGRLMGVYTPQEFLQAKEPVAAAYLNEFRMGSASE
ncbi:MAG TPA: ATP-binding cassette domain-containing protein [Candidatus Acidoferrales bacterium]|nr:ATP-binding cassette domain-containing protein [Candidatus Acidoferrales bacterium]